MLEHKTVIFKKITYLHLIYTISNVNTFFPLPNIQKDIFLGIFYLRKP